MSSKVRLICGMANAVLLLVTIGCESAEPTRTDAGGTPDAPDVQATIESLAVGADLGAATPTAVPPTVRAAAVEFARAHRGISRDWELFHGEMDAWRVGLASCDASAVQVALRQFAGRFAGVTAAARELPRPSAVRPLADKLISGAEQEEAALRLLRDTWQPGPAAAPSAPSQGDIDEESGESNGSGPPEAATPFEGVDLARSAASVLRQEVADILIDRAKKSAPASRSGVGEFVAGFNTIDSTWDEFHREYDSLRTQEGQLISVEIVAGLGLLVDRYRDIVVTIRQLPTSETTREVAELLAQAAEEEDLALRRLRGTFRKDGPSPEPVPVATPEPPAAEEDAEPLAEDPGPSEEDPGPDAEATFTPSDLGLFDAFDAQLVQSNGIRLEARRKMESILEDISEDARADVEEFSTQYTALLRQWDDFHREYDEWRRTEGGCDRSKAVDQLGSFTISFGKIANEVRGLPGATFLRPLGEILVEAAEREDRALRELRSTWQPYDVEVYRTLDQEHNAAGKLQRQVAVGIQGLLERYGVLPQELD